MRKRTGHHTSHADGSGYVSSLTGTPLRTKVYGTTFTFMFQGLTITQLLYKNKVYENTKAQNRGN